MNQPNNRVRIVIVISAIVLIILAIVLSIIGFTVNKNPYGESIKIQNYSAKVKNLSNDYENNISAALYDIVQKNSDSKVNGAEVKDALIRDQSEVQNEVLRQQRYQGSFIVDIASLKQSYSVQYAYSTRANDSFVSGYPILLSCLDEKDAIYKDFKCKDLVETEASTKQDALVNFLPHSMISYSLKADLSSGSLVLYATLNIPQSDLKGDAAANQETVRMYKKLVTDWIRSQGFDPATYTINYNYTDNGEIILNDEDNHADSDDL